jgi:aminomethyltransferase
MKYPLYGHELTDQTNPLEAGAGWVTKLQKPDFMGKAAILRAQAAGLKRKLVGLKLLERGIPRQGYAVFTPDKSRRIGEITSGTQSPSTQLPIGIAYVEIPFSETGSRVTVEIRGTHLSAEVIPTPFYKRPY